MNISSLITYPKRHFPLANWYLPGKLILSIRRLLSYSFFKLKRAVHLDHSFYMPGSSSIPIDVFMPAVEKDAQTLAISLRNIRENIRHPITNIYIVAPAKAKTINKIAKKEGCIFIDESTVLPFESSKINYVHNGENRAGWVYKMLLNLNADKVCTEENILIVDADVIFIRPHIFIYKGKAMFNASIFYHEPYFKANERIFGLKHRMPWSFVTHFMIFNSEALKKLREDIERTQKRVWYDGIIENIDKSEGSGFGDYEIYGDYYTNRLKWPYAINFWSNKDFSVDQIEELPELVELFKGKLGSLTFHNYDRN